jgi:hypothetical protein
LTEDDRPGGLLRRRTSEPLLRRQGRLETYPTGDCSLAGLFGELLEVGLGLDVLSGHVVEREVQTRRLHALQVAGLDLQREMFVVWDRRVLPIPARLFLDLLEGRAAVITQDYALPFRYQPPRGALLWASGVAWSQRLPAEPSERPGWGPP